MTTTIARPQHPVAAVPAPDYRAQGVRRAWLRDGVQVAGVLSLVVPVALWLATGVQVTNAASALKAAGILTGLVATSGVVLMLLLTARVPWIDRAMGQDRATALHAELGQWTFTGLLAHALFLVTAYALADRLTFFAEFASLWAIGDFVLAVGAIALLTAVSISSVVAVRQSFSFEVWKGIHLLTYVAIIASLPHQYSMGGLFSTGPSFWYWTITWALTFFSILTFRMFQPLFSSLEHPLIIASVTPEGPDAVTITMSGRHLDRVGARAGQYFHWRFLAPGLWWHQHPFSLSAQPTGSSLRITVRNLGAGSAALQRVKPGTRVFFEGPYGMFSDASRTASSVVMVGIGIGIAPIRALLEETRFAPGAATVILRARTPEELFLSAEVESLCRAKGARLYTLVGPRASDADGDRWVPRQYPQLTLRDLCPELPDADVYVCGPTAAADLVVSDAVAAGVPVERIHNERFSW